MTLKQLLKEYPVIVTTNEEGYGCFYPVIEWLKRKKLDFIIVKFRLIKDGDKYTILRKIAEGEEIKLSVFEISKRKHKDEYEPVRKWIKGVECEL